MVKREKGDTAAKMKERIEAMKGTGGEKFGYPNKRKLTERVDKGGERRSVDVSRKVEKCAMLRKHPARLFGRKRRSTRTIQHEPRHVERAISPGQKFEEPSTPYKSTIRAFINEPRLRTFVTDKSIRFPPLLLIIIKANLTLACLEIIAPISPCLLINVAHINITSIY
ncbi:hypothetical protein PUN28_008719 [Cardiocondyla obscurior]|uniref:Uncharacterized protein n=1 Tax=Cardiocondyla obscurior TaxID=286306 RepID=A0AAW2FZK5_9HYME